MGGPRKQRKKYSKPLHMWQKERIDEEKVLLKEYGLKNKKEIWKMESILRNLTRQAKKLITMKTEQAEKEKAQLLKRLDNIGLLPAGSQLSQVLGLTLKDVLGRRLQTIVYKRNLAKSVKQARQFITHGHIAVGNRKVTIPSYIVTSKEAEGVVFSQKSPISNETHPERSNGKENKRKGKNG